MISKIQSISGVQTPKSNKIKFKQKDNLSFKSRRSEDSYFSQLGKALIEAEKNKPDIINEVSKDTSRNLREEFVNNLYFHLSVPKSKSEDLFWDFLQIDSRSYHNSKHCENMLINKDRYLDIDIFKLHNEPLFNLAIFTHDRYPSIKDSIKYAVNILKESTSKKIKSNSNQDILKRLIKATDHKYDLPNLTREEKLISDLDLCVLASNKPDYKAYQNAIKKEYKDMKPVNFYTARLKLLENFLKKSSIFKLSFFKENYENIARNNILNEIQEIKIKLAKL